MNICGLINVVTDGPFYIGLWLIELDEVIVMNGLLQRFNKYLF